MQDAETPAAAAGQATNPETPQPVGFDPKEVAKYLPAPDVQRAITAVMIRLIGVGVIGFGSTAFMLATRTEWGWFHAIGTAVLMGCVCVGIAWAISGRSERLKELLETHRRRNVLGYTGMFWYEGGALRFRPYENEKGWDGWTPRADPIRAIGPCPKCPLGREEQHRERYHHPYAMIPLGGGRSSLSSFKNAYDAVGGIYVNGAIGRCGICWKIGLVGLTPDGRDLLVTVTDATGASIQCSLRQAFTILTIADETAPKVGLDGALSAIIAIASKRMPEPMMAGLSDVIAVMDRELREIMEERDAAIAERKQPKTRRKSASDAPPA
jgi:hypothetical protein